MNAVLATTALVLAMILAACGSGSSGSTDAPSAPSAGAPSAEATVVADAPVSEAPDDGGAAGGVCELVTPDELATAFAVASTSTSVIPGPPDACMVESDAGRTLAAWSHTLVGCAGRSTTRW